MVPRAMINAHRPKTGPAQGPSQHNPKRGNLVLLGMLREEGTSDLFIQNSPPMQNTRKHTRTHTHKQLLFDFVALYTITVQSSSFNHVRITIIWHSN